MKEKKRLHTIASAIAHLHMSYTLYNELPTPIIEMEKLITQMLEKDLDKGILSGAIADYNINIVEPKSPKAILKITITKTV